MARTVQLQELRASALSLVNREHDDPADGFIDNIELDDWINKAVGKYHTLLSRAEPERFEAEQTITADGSSSYALPADYYETIGVDYELTSDWRVELDRAMVAERNKYQTSEADQAVAYRIKGSSVMLLPPPSSGTYYHLYVTCAPVLVNPTDTIDGVNGWEDLIVFDVGIRLAAKEESFELAATLRDERNQIQAEMEAAAAERNAVSPSRVVNTRVRADRRRDPDFWLNRS